MLLSCGSLRSVRSFWLELTRTVSRWRGYSKDYASALHWFWFPRAVVAKRCNFVFWCSCVGRQKHFHCLRQTPSMHGCVDQDADLDSTPDFDSSQAGSSSQLAPDVTVGAKQFRCTEASFQRGYQCNIKCVVYIRMELSVISCFHVARTSSNRSISAWRRNRRRYTSSCCVIRVYCRLDHDQQDLGGISCNCS